MGVEYVTIIHAIDFLHAHAAIKIVAINPQDLYFSYPMPPWRSIISAQRPFISLTE